MNPVLFKATVIFLGENSNFCDFKQNYTLRFSKQIWKESTIYAELEKL